MPKQEAVSLLMADSNPIGTFMVRRSADTNFSLSIKCHSESEGDHMKKFLIRGGCDDYNKVCLFPDIIFDSIVDLIEYYVG